MAALLSNKQHNYIKNNISKIKKKMKEPIQKMILYVTVT